MMKIIKNMDELKAFLKAAGSKLVVIKFSAEWCGPCKRISPLIHAMSLQYQNVMFASIDVDDARELAETYNIRAIPTFLLFKETEKLQRDSHLDQFRYHLKTCKRKDL